MTTDDLVHQLAEAADRYAAEGETLAAKLLLAAQATITALSQTNKLLKETMALRAETTKEEGASQPLRADIEENEK